MQILPFTVLYPTPDSRRSIKTICDNAKHSFNDFYDRKMYEHQAGEQFVVASIKSDLHHHIGLICLTSTDEVEKGKIKVHELTLAEKEHLMHKTYLNTNAMLKPILLGFDANDEFFTLANAIIKNQSPTFKINLGKEHHEYFLVSEPNHLAAISTYFSQKIKRAYIADGHHRLSIYKAESKKFPDKNMAFLSMYLPFSQLDILPFHRIIHINLKADRAQFLEKLSSVVHLKPLSSPRLPSKKGEVTMKFQDQFFSITWPHKTDDFDVNLFNTNIVKGVCGIEDIRYDPKLLYIEGDKPLDWLLKKYKCSKKIMFFFHPMLLSDIKNTADKDRILPPKSTYFVPRIRSGITVCKQ